MKALTQLTNVDKAALLHGLFPAEIPALLDFITGMCRAVREDEQRNRAAWDNGFMSFDYWLGLIHETEDLIARKGPLMIKSSRAFSEQLFSGYTALYVNHCISLYTRVKVHPNLNSPWLLNSLLILKRYGELVYEQGGIRCG